MNVLSLFDGISCGRIALERAGIKVDNYYASEIDTYALKISKKNYPDIKQVGSVIELDTAKLPKIDLVMGGSPCQSLSSCGDKTGFKGKSGLFWEFVRILNGLKQKNPNIYFLLENVLTKKEWEQTITDSLGVEPIFINSSLVSGQSRKRNYWTNIPNIEQPKDKGIYLKDILQENASHIYNYSKKSLLCFDTEVRKDKIKNMDLQDRKYYVPNFADLKNPKVFVDRKKSLCITANYQKQMPLNYMRSQGQLVFDNDNIRRLTPNECELLQNLPLNYTEGIPDAHRYTTIGNGWTVDVIAHIFRQLNF